MTTLSRYFEIDDLGGGKFRHTVNLRDIAYLVNGSYQRIIPNFVDGDVNFPNVINTGPFLTRITSQGDWRIHPTRDPDVWFSISAPFTNPANPTRVTLNPFSRTGNTLTSTNVNFDARIIFGGHLVKLEFVLKTALARNVGQVAFPIGAQGVTRVGTQLQVNGVTVMNLTRPVVYDAANDRDVRSIAVDFRSVAGQLYAFYTLPSLAGMTLPVIDPTLTLQPDEASGIDTFISSPAPTLNFGVYIRLYIGEDSGEVDRTLIKFDLSSLPSNAIISSNTLSLDLNRDLATNASTVAVYRMKRAWAEGTGNGVASGDGATWNTYDGVNNWTTAGGFSATDCEQTDIGNLSLTGSESLAVKNWTLTPTSKAALDLGYGWMIKSTTESSDLYGYVPSNAGLGGSPPKFVCVYTIPTGSGGVFLSSITHSAIFGGSVR